MAAYNRAVTDHGAVGIGAGVVISHWYFGESLSTWALLAEIGLAGVIVVVTGWRLTKLADQVASAYGLGNAWVGVLLLATVTSLPEVVTGVTATWIGQADMAFSAIYGSCSFNIILIVLLNGVIGGGSILHGKGRAHTLGSSFGIVMISISLLGILLTQKYGELESSAQTIEVVTAVLIALTYFFCMKMVYRTEEQTKLDQELDEPTGEAKDGLMVKVCVAAGVLVVAAWWLARTGDVLAEHPIELLGGRALGATFVGFLFLALATSLPEVVTGLSAVRIGNLDMALGNIFGSNMFNVFVIPMLKVASYVSGDPLLMAGEGFHTEKNLVAGLLPILLTGVVVGGISYRSSRTLLRRFGVDSALLFAIYIIGMLLLLS